MNINRINPAMLYQSNINTPEPTFKNRRKLYYIRKPVLKSNDCIKVYEKANKLLNKLPNGKMEVTALCKVNDNQYGIRWNTQDSDNLFLKIKDKIDTNTTEEWEKAKVEQTVMECYFNKDGIMQNASITKKLKNNFSLNAFYHRNRNIKTLLIDDVTYRLAPNTEDCWISIPTLSCYRANKDIEPRKYFKEIELIDLFCTLINKNTTIK